MKNISRTIKASILTAAAAIALTANLGATANLDVEQMVGGLSCAGVGGMTIAAEIMAIGSGGANVVADVASFVGTAYLWAYC